MHDPAFFPGWLRLSHFVNIIFLSFLMRSGIQILAAFPRLYWTDNCRPGVEWVKFTRKRVPVEDPDRIYASQEEQADRGTDGRPVLSRRIHLLSLTIWGLRWLVYAVRRRVGARKHAGGAGRIYTSLEEEKDISPWLALPGHKQLGLGRHWHFVSD
ncbi:MAG: hypothetical protein ACRDGS_09165, partial [Chloroflexota bacterium]